MTLSVFTPPRLSWGFWPVLLRHLRVWRKFAFSSVIGHVADPLISLVAFGYGMGSLVGAVNGVPYIQFLASGTIAVSCALSATFESLYSAYARMEDQKTWEGILNSPLSLDDILLAELLWSTLKAMFTSVAILGVIFALDISRTPAMLLALPVMALTGLAFSGVALVCNAMAKGYEFFTYYFTLVMTPMTFLSGVYFPIEQMPGWLQQLAHLMPLTAAVTLARPLVMGQVPGEVVQPLCVLVGYAVSGYVLALMLTRKRFFK